MEEILHTVKNIAIFILLFSIVSNLFSRSKYRKYFDFVQGVILVLLVMTPLFARFADGTFLDGLLEKNMVQMEENFRGDELEMIGEQREQMIRGETGEGWEDE